MKDWRDDFNKKIIKAEEAAGLVKSGDTVAFTMGREAFACGLALAARKNELRAVKVLVPSPGYDFGWYDEGWQDSFEVSIMMPTDACQQAIDAKRVDFFIHPLLVVDSDFCGGSRFSKPDVLFTEVSPPDNLGFCSFGQSLWDKKKHVNNARLVIAEINNNLIRTYGDNFIHVSQIDWFVEHISTGGTPGMGSLAGRKVKEPEAYLKKVAEHVSSLIGDGNTMQIGVGRTTEPLVRLGLFKEKNDLGWHSEATPPGVISLIRDGVINGKRKTINTGKAIVTSIGGSTRDEMEWIINNPLINLVDVSYLQDLRVISAHDNFTAINNTLLVDLSGQLTAETLGTRIISTAGGQIAFVFGALLSKGGKSITVLPSTAQGGKASRIVPLLPQGSSVTIQRNCADFIVTEFGVARLKGKTLRQRAQELIAISHPDFRTELNREAHKLYWP